MSVSADKWQSFLQDAPAHVIEVIEDGPFPLSEYGSERISIADKRRGISRFKGGKGNISVKSGQKAVVYFDPTFAESVENIPSHIEARHSESEVIEVFKTL